MQGGFLEETNTSTQPNNKLRERGGLIPITAKILNESSINQEECVEYMGHYLSDISIVGYLMDFNETETKIKVKIWDQTGMCEIVFFNKNENEVHSGLINFNFTQ